MALPGVQVLFAFLLIAPFNQGWHQTSGYERKVYVVALMCAAAASILLMATSAFHRHRFPRLAERPRRTSGRSSPPRTAWRWEGSSLLPLPCALRCSWCSTCSSMQRSPACSCSWSVWHMDGSGTACRCCADGGIPDRVSARDLNRETATRGGNPRVLAPVSRAFEFPLVHLRPSADARLTGFVVELPVRSPCLPGM